MAFFLLPMGQPAATILDLPKQLLHSYMKIHQSVVSCYYPHTTPSFSLLPFILHSEYSVSFTTCPDYKCTALQEEEERSFLDGVRVSFFSVMGLYGSLLTLFDDSFFFCLDQNKLELGRALGQIAFNY